MDRLSPRGRLIVERFSDLTDYDGDVGDAFHATGMSYDAFRKMLLRSDRVDLLSKLSAWRAEDTKRLHYALGKKGEVG